MIKTCTAFIAPDSVATRLKKVLLWVVIRIIDIFQVLALVLIMTGGSAWAGDLSINSGAFGSGYALPLSTLAALLGFIAIGLLAGLTAGSAPWQLPTIAIGVALTACLAGEAGIALPYVHQGLMAALAVLGTVILLGIRLPLLTPGVLTALTAVFEGFPLAHAAHGPHLWSWLGYAVAAMLAMASGIGLTMMVCTPKSFGPRMLGGGIAVVGVLMLLNRL
ncbi:MAG: HupE/UreJ family protein [Rhodospirillaceae bacterium]